MRLSFAAERVLAVVAHPDDAEILCAGTLARAKADGAAIGICVMCQGDKGQPPPPLPNLAEVRRAEMTAAANLLGAELFFGEFADATLADGPAERRRLMEVFRHFRPTLVLAHAANDYHADHRAASALAEAASWFSASPGHRTTEPPLPEPPALWWLDTISMADFLPAFYIDISPHVELKRRMLARHGSQLPRSKEKSPAPLEEMMLQQCRMRGAQANVAAAEAFQAHLAWKRARAW